MPILLLYGLDENTLPIDAEVTCHSIQSAEVALRSIGWHVESREVKDDLTAALVPFPPDQWLVFNLCEGAPSQPFYYAHAARELELRGYAFTGSDSSALHETQFKPLIKQALETERVPTPRWSSATRPEDCSFDIFPAIVKPAAEHCSFGITRESVVFNLEEARRQIAAINSRYEGGAMIEEFLDSEEYGISMWGSEPAVFGISVIRYNAFADARDRLCTFDAKWLPETEAYHKTMPTCPPPLSPALQAELEAVAKRAHRACRGRDYSRIDVRLKHGRPMVLDVNINCAVSENSGFVDTARLAAGLSYAAVLDRLAMLAFRRRASVEPMPLAFQAGQAV